MSEAPKSKSRTTTRDRWIIAFTIVGASILAVAELGYMPPSEDLPGISFSDIFPPTKTTTIYRFKRDVSEGEALDRSMYEAIEIPEKDVAELGDVMENVSMDNRIGVPLGRDVSRGDYARFWDFERRLDDWDSEFDAEN